MLSHWASVRRHINFSVWLQKPEMSRQRGKSVTRLWLNRTMKGIDYAQDEHLWRVSMIHVITRVYMYISYGVTWLQNALGGLLSKELLDSSKKYRNRKRTIRRNPVSVATRINSWPCVGMQGEGCDMHCIVSLILSALLFSIYTRHQLEASNYCDSVISI